MLFGKKERHAESLIARHIEVVGDVVNLMQKTVKEYCKDCTDFKATAVEVQKREHDADEVRRDVEMTLYEGAFMPVERGDFVTLIERVDKVANQCEAVAEFLLLTRPDVDDDTKNGITEMMESTVRCYSHIPEMMKSMEDGRVVMSMAHKVEEEERTVDQLFERSVRRLFKEDYDLARKIHVKMLLDRVAAISNRVEDASDRFCVIVAKRP
jgi:predicted phosphate transport protein (TIGR00153 family)